MIVIKTGDRSAISNDLVHWVSGDPVGVMLTTCCVRNGIYLASSYGSGVSFISNDGLSWSSVAALDTAGMIVRTLKFINGYFVALGKDAAGTNMLMYSVDGVTWADASPADSNGMLKDIAEKDGTYVVTCLNGIQYTTDDIFDGTPPNWTYVVFDGANPAEIIIATGSHFITGGEQRRFAYSTNGIDWTEGQLAWAEADATFNSFASDGQYIYSCTGTRILICAIDDPSTWTQHGILADVPRDYYSMVYIQSLGVTAVFCSGGRIFANTTAAHDTFTVLHDTTVGFSQEACALYEAGNLVTAGLDSASMVVAKTYTLEGLKDSGVTGFTGLLQTYAEQLVDRKLPKMVAELNTHIRRVFSSIQRIIALGDGSYVITFPVLTGVLYEDLIGLNAAYNQCLNLFNETGMDGLVVPTDDQTTNETSAVGDQLSTAISEIESVNARIKAVLDNVYTSLP